MIPFVNFRPLCSNKYTRINTVFRTGNIYDFYTNNFEFLKKYNVKYFIDFRSKNEIYNNYFLIEKLKKYNVIWINFSIDNSQDWKIIQNPIYQNYAIYYMGILQHGKSGIYRFFKFLADVDDESSIVYGCSLGKDRTGVISYLLLKILDANELDIFEDYCLSKKYLFSNKAVIDYFKNKGYMDYEKRCDTNKVILDLFVKFFENKYFTVSNYLKEIGITEHEQIQIKKKWRVERNG